MTIRLPLICFCLAFTLQATAQLSPAITHWIINTKNHTGFGGIATNVQQVQYSTNNVYISTTDIAEWIPVGYNWPNNPWAPVNKNYVFKITLTPTQNMAPPVKAPYGHVGIWTNGVSIYNPKDAKSYLDSATWYQNAFFFEHLNQETMDSCLGHPNGNFEYHLHVHPKCLYDYRDSTQHSPLIGYAFDGFPIYGAFGYATATAAGPVKRMRTSYRLRNITNRTVLPNGTVLTAPYYGPPLSTYPLGAYCEDYEYVMGLGDLDIHNGRYCVTPEYPAGTYAYFVSLDSLGEPIYPYVLGPTYYGTVQNGNLGPTGGYNVISEPVTTYTSPNSIATVEDKVEIKIYPNPATDQLFIQTLNEDGSKTYSAAIYSITGKLITGGTLTSGYTYLFPTDKLSNGMYFISVLGQSGIKNYPFEVIH